MHVSIIQVAMSSILLILSFDYTNTLFLRWRQKGKVKNVQINWPTNLVSMSLYNYYVMIWWNYLRSVFAGIHEWCWTNLYLMPSLGLQWVKGQSFTLMQNRRLHVLTVKLVLMRKIVHGFVVIKKGEIYWDDCNWFWWLTNRCEKHRSDINWLEAGSCFLVQEGLSWENPFLLIVRYDGTLGTHIFLYISYSNYYTLIIFKPNQLYFILIMWCLVGRMWFLVEK